MFDLSQYDMKCSECNKLAGQNPIECAKCLDYLNRLRLLMTPFSYDENSGKSEVEPETLQKLGSTHMISLIKGVEYSLGDHYKLLKMLQGAVAACSALYDVRIIKARVPDPQAAEKRENFNAIVQKQKESEKPKIQKVAMSAQEKAISKLMGTLKLSRSDAEKIVLGAIEGDGGHVAKVWKDPSLEESKV